MNEIIIYLIPFLIAVESNGNDNAIGDNGKALGCLQIWEICVNDVNRIYKTTYKHKDALDRKKAVEICRLYLSYWGKHYEKKTGKKVTLEVLARMWNGGPKGYKNKNTIKYWNKLKEAIK